MKKFYPSIPAKFYKPSPFKKTGTHSYTVTPLDLRNMLYVK